MSAKKKNRPRRREAGKAKIKIPDQGGSIDPDIIIGGPKPDGGTLPDEILGGAFSKLDADLPLLLLPVRIETNYNLDPDPPELRIRIYPDQIHIDSDWPQHSAAEVELVKEYWIRWHIAKMDLEKQIAWAWFIGQVIPQRAVYLARIYEPTVGKDGKLIFPSPDFDAMTTPAHPVLLPHCWLAIGYGIGGAQIFLKAGQPVAPDLRTGPDPEATAVDLSGGDLNIDEGLAWMIDYDLAVEAGMAITIPLTGDALEATDKVQVLLVIGVMEDSTPQAAATELARLLEVHARTTGLAFVPQGTPTNNTATVAAGWTPQETEYPAPTERASKGSRTGPITGHPTEPSQIDYDDNAFQLARALGLSNPASLRDLPFGSEREAAQSRYMRTVLFEAVMGTLLRELLDVGTQNAIGGRVPITASNKTVRM
jgi:hypothetical protein